MDVNPVQGIRDAVAAAPVPVSPQQAAQNRELVQAVKALNKTQFFGSNHELTFAMDRDSHRFVARIVDRDTKEVIQQIPPEYVLRLAEEMDRIYA